ncbi:MULTISPECIES: TetR/AcrR family transcriptional regulator [unclassified Butyrivibrio]|jgi:AcrR family transcriptional regulator|uniref:TetR/AcrR family transcriptional regulator n=1 Tax=unclassified Butyrivibrio TaxID=2639466 RepID=UPI0004944203|nr:MULTISPECIES: TetR/AcrR family transcriptional regulator [unclassified Butyrivibrio]SEQ50302.1 transcriptional regulator, TetR family [Butyrivibrio sp. TB]
MNKNESKYFKSAEKMHTALLTLLDSKDFELISVKEICETAGVNRSTFYLHYDNVNDLLHETVEAVYKDFFGRFGAEGPGALDIDEKKEDELFLVTPKYLMPYLDFVEENRKLFYLMYEKNEMMGAEKTYETWFKTIFGPILTRFGVPQKEQPLIMVFYLKGIIGVVTEWVRGGCTESKDEIISVIQKCIIKP